MTSSFIRSPALLITLPLLALLATSHQANAEIYKWRDNRGVTQYSDRPPVSNFTKVTRNEMVNALQTKDLCTVGPIQKSVASAKNLNTFFGFTVKKATTTNFFGIPVTQAASTSSFITNTANTRPVSTGSVAASPTSSPVSSARPTATAPTVSSPATAPVTSQTSPLGIPSTFNSGSNNITVFGIPRPTRNSGSNFFGIRPTQPAATAPTAPVAAPAPVTAAPAPIIVPPVQVAVNTPAPLPVIPNASPNLIQVGLMPAVDISKNMTHAIGSGALKINPTTEVTPNSHTGAFRISCAPSHMSNDDPIVYPNQQGAAHHHTFFGNVSLDYKSNLSNLSATGNSTCAGGIMNRSAYWIPSLIDTTTNTPILPTSTIFYYKSTVDVSLVKAPPKGLRMITGNSRAKSAADVKFNSMICYPGPNSKRTVYGWNPHIPKGDQCEAGDTLTIDISFPQCWDGVNLDSPSHQDHVVFPTHRPVAPPDNWFCPATHPVVIPQVSMITSFTVTKAAQEGNWRLASDNYEKTSAAGYSMHADWVNGWDEATMAGIVKNCLNARKDAHAHLLCDGRTFYN